MLCKATGEDVPDDMKLTLLSRAIDQNLGEESDKERAKEIFCEVLRSLSPELVRLKITKKSSLADRFCPGQCNSCKIQK